MGSVRGEVGGAEKGACGSRSRRARALACSAGAVGGIDECGCSIFALGVDVATFAAIFASNELINIYFLKDRPPILDVQSNRKLRTA